MTQTLINNITTLYESDYFKWLEKTLDKLRNQEYEQIDWGILIEEIETMGRSEKNALESNLIIILLHLLKWQYQPQKQSGSWERSIIEHRRRVRRALQDSPSLKSYLVSILEGSYYEAVKQAKAETKLPLSTFPKTCPYLLTSILDDQFFP
jgi:hypothetical protein